MILTSLVILQTRQLYYEPSSGTYYQYDATTKRHLVHSRVNVQPQYPQQQPYPANQPPSAQQPPGPQPPPFNPQVPPPNQPSYPTQPGPFNASGPPPSHPQSHPTQYNQPPPAQVKPKPLLQMNIKPPAHIQSTQRTQKPWDKQNTPRKSKGTLSFASFAISFIEIFLKKSSA